MPVFSLKLKNFLFSFLLPLAVGFVGSFAVRSGLDSFVAARKPLLTPPPAVFAVVWTVLYLLMGVASYLISCADVRRSLRVNALRLFYIQLAVNLLWPIAFFGLGLWGTAAVIIVILWVLVLMTVLAFLKVDRLAGRLMIPYLVWISFAAYLNIGIAVLNR